MSFGILLHSTQLKASIRYVKPTASGTGDGSSWANASADLQTMIDSSSTNDEIWVAAGTYKPTKNTSGNATPPNNREKTFYIKRNINVYGGFAGTEIFLIDRNPSTNLTILSGDFNNNDAITGEGATLVITNNSENAYRVVTIDGTSAAGTIDATCVVDGFTITKGNMGSGTIGGAGLYINGSGSGKSCSPTINNCNFSYNDAAITGALFCDGRNGGTANPLISNCIFDRNRANEANGALFCSGSNSGVSNPTIDHCTFSNNSAGLHEGGAMYIQAVSGGIATPTISNCIFENNAAGDYGGAIFCHASVNPIISNCIFTRNISAGYGGGIFYYGQGNENSTLTNCVFENNTTTNYGGAIYAQAYSGDAIDITLTNCTFMNNSASIGSAFHSNNVGNTTTIKNSIFFGTNAATLIGKLAGTITPTYSLFKEGATNFTADASNIMTSFSPFATYTTLIGADNTWFTADDGGQLTLCSPAINAGTNIGAPTTDILGNAIYGTTKDIGAYEYQSSACPAIRYVKPIASGTGDGSSWANASADLQVMIDNSLENDQIWVAAGTYKPTKDMYSDPAPMDDREKTFYINKNIRVYGGFAGIETSLSARNLSANLTILSGDFNGDDVITGSDTTLLMTNNSENAYHIVTIDGTSPAGTINATCVIDGFTITKGNMDLGYIGGAAIFNNANVYGAISNPTINNCKFIYNYGAIGGAIYNFGNPGEASPIISNCTFENNTAIASAGIHNNGNGGGISNPIISNCIFSNNVAQYQAGAIFCEANTGGVSNAIISNCAFNNNAAGAEGGAIFCVNGANPSMSNCIFTHNNTKTKGGAVYYAGDGGYTVSTLTNCVFENNTSILEGGAIFAQGVSGYTSDITVLNCSFINNNAPAGSAMNSDYGSTINILNTIVFGTNATTLFGGSGGTITPTYSLFTEGATNFTASSTNLTTSSSPFATYNTLIGTDNTWFTADDGGQLLPCSPAIDAGTNAGAPTTDILGNAIYNTTKDIGAYERRTEACPVYAGTSACQTVTLSNVSGNQWINIVNSNGLVASINPNGINLGTVTAEISDAANTISRNDAKFLSKSVTLSSSLYPNSATMPSSYSLRLYYSDAELADYNSVLGSTATVSDINIAWISGGSACTLNNYSGTASGIIDSTDITDGEFGTGNNGFYLQFSLNHFTIFGATTSGAVAFPIKLLSFSAENKNYQNLLSWATETEINNDRFEIERGNDAIHFEKIGDTKGAGNSTTTQYYQFTDENPFNGKNYYRLKQVDINGSFSYSNVVEVELDIANGVAIFPNPTQNELFIRAERIQQEVRVTDEMGKVVFQANSVPNKINVSTWRKGIYFVIIGNKSFKFAKE